MDGSKEKGRAKGGLLFVAALGVIGIAMAAPFVYESQSLYYKFGMDRALLQWGKALGVAAVVIMTGQVGLVSGLKLLDRILGMKRLFSLHKRMGILIALLVLGHPLLILWSDGFTLFPLELRYWPEFIGVLTLAVLLIIVGVSLFRNALGIPHRSWRVFHRITALTLLPMAFIHAGFVSGTFDHNLPRYGLAVLGGAALVLVVRIMSKRRKPPSNL